MTLNHPHPDEDDGLQKEKSNGFQDERKEVESQLHQLYGLFGSKAIPKFHLPREQDIPPLHKDLLFPCHHMTPTLENYFNSLATLNVLEVHHQHRDQGSFYARKITLSFGTKIAELALMVVDLTQLNEMVVKDVVAASIPMGRILSSHKVATKVTVHHLVCLENDVEEPHNGKKEDDGENIIFPAFARVASIQCDGKPAIRLLEILNSDAFDK